MLSDSGDSSPTIRLNFRRELNNESGRGPSNRHSGIASFIERIQRIVERDE